MVTASQLSVSLPELRRLVFDSTTEFLDIRMYAVQAAVPAGLHKLLYSCELEFGVCSRIIAG